MEGYGSRFIESAFEIPLSTLRYWDKQSIVKPSLRPAAGRGSRCLYAFRDLVQLRVVQGLKAKGVPLQRIRRCVDYLRAEFPSLETPLSELTLVTDGETVFVKTTDPEILLDTLRKGQFVWCVPIGQWAEEMRSAIARMTRQRLESVTVAGRVFTYHAKQDPEDGWWVALVDDLPGCGSQGRSIEELREMVADAVYGYLVVRGDIEDDAEAAYAAAV